MSDEVPIEVHSILERTSGEVALQHYRVAHSIRFWKGETNPRSAAPFKTINLASETLFALTRARMLASESFYLMLNVAYFREAIDRFHRLPGRNP